MCSGVVTKACSVRPSCLRAITFQASHYLEYSSILYIYIEKLSRATRELRIRGRQAAEDRTRPRGRTRTCQRRQYRRAAPHRTVPRARAMEHVEVFREAGRFGGWPANYGMYSFGDEIVLLYTV